MSTESRSSAQKPRVLVTRAAGQASALADELRRLGAEPINVPVLQIVPPDSFEELDDALAELTRFHWLLFTSANAVEALAARAKHAGFKLNVAGIKIAAIGSATARALGAIDRKPDLVPAIAVAESMAEALLPFARQPDGTPTRFLFVRAQEGREHLPETLRGAGAEVTVATAYKTQVPREGIAELRKCFDPGATPPDGLTLTSSSASRNFFALVAAAELKLPEQTVIASIGPITSATLRELGYPPHIEAEQASVQALAKVMMEYLQARP